MVEEIVKPEAKKNISVEEAIELVKKSIERNDEKGAIDEYKKLQ